MNNYLYLQLAIWFVFIVASYIDVKYKRITYTKSEKLFVVALSVVPIVNIFAAITGAVFIFRTIFKKNEE